MPLQPARPFPAQPPGPFPVTARAARWLVPMVAGLALALQVFLFLEEGGLAPPLAGCGGEGGCAALRATRWARVLGMPVAVPGIVVYLAFLGAWLAGRRALAAALAATIAGAALWFTALQALVLGRFCPVCCVLHGMGLVVAGLAWVRLRASASRRRLLAACLPALPALGLLAALQIFGPAPSGHRLADLSAPAGAAAARPLAAGGGRVVEFGDGRLAFAVESLPRLGPADAPRVMVEFFDYACPACRILAGHLDALLAAYPGQIAVVVLPVPLDRACNPHLPENQAAYPGACEVAALALAVWHAAPDHFAAFHRKLIAGPEPTPALAARAARDLIGAQALQQGLADPRGATVRAAAIADWHALSQANPHLPKLLVRDQRILHGLPSDRRDFIRVLASELGLAAPGS
jgi:protein-disulfide isomerase/uncharacterized membrane protein